MSKESMLGAICSENETCTYCPARAECNVRPLFYDSDTYESMRLEVFAQATTLVDALGLSAYSFLLVDNIKKMDKRRNQELALHPTYSKT